MAKSKVAASEIFRKALERKKKVQPSYSLRALARDLGVSAAFMSKVMNGEKPLPKERLEKICFLLELDLLEKDLVARAMLKDAFGNVNIPLVPIKKKTERRTSDAAPKSILSSWANLAVLEALTLEGDGDIKVLRKRLGLSEAETQRILKLLAEGGLIQEVDGRWVKQDQHLYFAGGRSRSEVRAFHDMMITKALTELRSKTAQGDYERRLINGFTFTLNREALEEFKSKLIEFMDEFARDAGAMPGDDVYQLNMQFFPLTAPENE